MTRRDRILFAKAMAFGAVPSAAICVAGGAPLWWAVTVSVATSAATYGLTVTMVWWLIRRHGL